MQICSRQDLFAAFCCVAACLCTVAAADAQFEADNPPELVDGLRRIEARRYGVTVLHPPGWKLTNLMRGDRAFVLALPDDHPSEASGSVTCEIGAAPASLAEFQKLLLEEGAAAPPGRKLDSCQMLKTAPRGPETPSLEAIWSLPRIGGQPWFEMKRYVILNRQIYTFVLHVDQGHFEAYRLEFERMVNTARFRVPEIGMEQRPGGYWVQRDFGIGLLLPRNWLPALGGSERALYFAAAPAERTFAGNVVVVGGKLKPLDLDVLKADLPDELRKSDPQAVIVRSEIIIVGKQQLLETVYRTRRGPLALTVIDRRFQGKRRNYEIRFTVQSENFEKFADDLRDSAGSFREFALDNQKEVI